MCVISNLDKAVQKSLHTEIANLEKNYNFLKCLEFGLLDLHKVSAIWLNFSANRLANASFHLSSRIFMNFMMGVHFTKNDHFMVIFLFSNEDRREQIFAKFCNCNLQINLKNSLHEIIKKEAYKVEESQRDSSVYLLLEELFKSSYYNLIIIFQKIILLICLYFKFYFEKTTSFFKISKQRISGATLKILEQKSKFKILFDLLFANERQRYIIKTVDFPRGMSM